MKKLAVFDIEVLYNCFVVHVRVVGGESMTFEISERRNEYSQFVKFFSEAPYVFVGYNCIHYDTPIVNALILNQKRFEDSHYISVTKFAKELGDTIIDKAQTNRSWTKYKYSNIFAQIDLMTMMASKRLRVSLKSLQVTMCYKNVKEFKIDWNKPIKTGQIDDLIHYCKNDTGSTEYLLKLLKDEIAFRIAVQKEYGIECLSKDGVGIGVDIFTKYICQELDIYHHRELFNYVDIDNEIHIKDLILPKIKFKTKKFQALLDWYNSIVVDLTKYEELSDKQKEELYQFTVTYNNLSHAYGFGGMHSKNLPKIVESCDRFFLSDMDVESYYPSLGIMYHFAPRGFRMAFVKVLSDLKDQRVIAKNSGDKVKNTLFKLALNSILGNLKNRYSPFYDPAANLSICINGQLLLSMLIEECELIGIECISSNTDGATFKVPVHLKDQYYKICEEWQKMSLMKLEEARYEKMVIVAVNDYIAFKEGYSKVKDKLFFHKPEKAINFNFTNLLLKGDAMTKLKDEYVKEKGIFITYPRLGKGLEFLIVSKALQNYYGKQIPIEETISQFMSVHDYLKTEKVGSQYEVEWNQQPQQRVNRFFVEKGAPYLYKVKDKLDEQSIIVKSKQNLLKGHGVRLVNDLTEQNDFNVDYNFYVSKCREVIDKLEPAQLTLF